jgi:sugar/nucleoside kinase (ribokinase family)
VSIDLAVLTPTYLDYTFVGLEALPGPGEERFAGDMLRSPGGGGISAVAAARLGLATALIAPLGDDLAGRFVRQQLEDEGVVVGEPRGNRTPTTMVMPVGGERAMVTVDPGLRARVADLELHAPRALAATLEQIDILPDGPCAYLTCGDDDARAFARRLPHGLRKPRGLIVNQREAEMLTGEADPARAATQLADVAESAMVCMGPDGELFAIAFAWAELHDADAEVALQWANLYGGLSVKAPTGAGGALTREQLLEEGARRGLPELPGSARAA